jgi:hypothetical protein
MRRLKLQMQILFTKTLDKRNGLVLKNSIIYPSGIAMLHYELR